MDDPNAPAVPNTPNVAPSQQHNLFRGLLFGSLLGLAGAANQTGPEATPAGQIGAGVKGVIGAEQQNYENQLQQTGAEQKNVALGQEQQRIANEQQRIDIERSTALIQKLHLEALIQHMGVQDRLDTMKTYQSMSELYKKNGAYSMGEVAPEDVASFFKSHPEVKPGDIHPNPVEFDENGDPTKYEMLNLNKAVVPAGTTVDIGGDRYTLRAPMLASQLDSASINNIVKTSQIKVAGQYKVEAAAVMGQFSALRTKIQVGGMLDATDLRTAEGAMAASQRGLQALVVAGTNAAARNPILTSMGLTPTGDYNQDLANAQALMRETSNTYNVVRSRVQATNPAPNSVAPTDTSKGGFDPSKFPKAE